MKKTLILILSIFCFACKQPADETIYRNEILQIHKDLTHSHLEKNPDFFIHNLSNDFFSVKNGEILRPSVEEIRANMTDYINNTTINQYRDLQEPIVGFSDDYSTAWIIVQVLVQGDRKLNDGSICKIDFTYAWLTLYQHSINNWLIIAEASTFK